MSFPFDLRRNLILVTARIHNHSDSETLDLALDTGATRTVISQEVLLSLGYEPSPLAQRARILTGSGAMSAPLIRVAKIEALGQTMANMPVICHTLPSRAAIDGVLGLDFLRGGRLTIDFRAGMLSLE